jgi:hypothetical protein
MYKGTNGQLTKCVEKGMQSAIVGVCTGFDSGVFGPDVPCLIRIKHGLEVVIVGRSVVWVVAYVKAPFSCIPVSGLVEHRSVDRNLGRLIQRPEVWAEECAHKDLGTESKCAIDARTGALRGIAPIAPVADLLSTRWCVVQDLLTIQ